MDKAVLTQILVDLFSVELKGQTETVRDDAEKEYSAEREAIRVSFDDGTVFFVTVEEG